MRALLRNLLLRFGPYEDLAGYLRGLGIAVTVGLFLTFAGAFGTDDAPIGERLAYWMVMMLTGYVWGTLVARLFFHRDEPRTGNIWLDVVVASALMAVPFSVVVWLASTWIFDAQISTRGLPFLFGSVFMVALVITALNVLIERGPHTVTHAAPAPPKFVDRLPLKLRGAEVWAVEAEDHYLRLHTSKGQDLILLRLADAISELEGIEGAQVHRSWWVARDAITDARRGDGRATLTLKDGAEVPVSRTYAGFLREQGWI